MAGETTITVIGNLTADPELRFTNSGVALASFTVASTPRSFDKNTNGWKDGGALFLRCTAWREYGENIAASLTKGARVIVQGNLSQRSYEKDGVKRTSYELDVVEAGPSLRFSTAQVTRAERRDGGYNATAPQSGTQGQSGSAGGSQSAPGDGWANPGQAFNETEAPF